jgi:Pyruvate/2-oxoacid:ferredoxin oxidoreductase delta subunit
MHNKSIFSLISFFLLSMFYVSSASAGPKYINIKMSKECGAWENAGNAHHCWALNTNKGKAGKRASFKCSAGYEAGVFAIKMKYCPMAVISVEGSGRLVHVTNGWCAGGASCTSVSRKNTITLELCHPDDRRVNRKWNFCGYRGDT